MATAQLRIEEELKCGGQDSNLSSESYSFGEPYIYKGNRIGTLFRALHRFVMEKKESQIFRLYQAWSIETSVLVDLINQGVTDIRILQNNPDGSQILYKTTPEIWLKNSIINKFRVEQNPTAYMRVSLFQRFG